jgi:hypothetical protein
LKVFEEGEIEDNRTLAAGAEGRGKVQRFDFNALLNNYFRGNQAI